MAIISVGVPDLLVELRARIQLSNDFHGDKRWTPIEDSGRIGDRGALRALCRCFNILLFGEAVYAQERGTEVYHKEGHRGDSSYEVHQETAVSALRLRAHRRYDHANALEGLTEVLLRSGYDTAMYPSSNIDRLASNQEPPKLYTFTEHSAILALLHHLRDEKLGEAIVNPLGPVSTELLVQMMTPNDSSEDTKKNSVARYSSTLMLARARCLGPLFQPPMSDWADEVSSGTLTSSSWKVSPITSRDEGIQVYRHLLGQSTDQRAAVGMYRDKYNAEEDDIMLSFANCDLPTLPTGLLQYGDSEIMGNSLSQRQFSTFESQRFPSKAFEVPPNLQLSLESVVTMSPSDLSQPPAAAKFDHFAPFSFEASYKELEVEQGNRVLDVGAPLFGALRHYALDTRTDEFECLHFHLSLPPLDSTPVDLVSRANSTRGQRMSKLQIQDALDEQRKKGGADKPREKASAIAKENTKALSGADTADLELWVHSLQIQTTKQNPNFYDTPKAVAAGSFEKNACHLCSRRRWNLVSEAPITYFQAVYSFHFCHHFEPAHRLIRWPELLSDMALALQCLPSDTFQIDSSLCQIKCDVSNHPLRLFSLSTKSFALAIRKVEIVGTCYGRLKAFSQYYGQIKDGRPRAGNLLLAFALCVAEFLALHDGKVSALIKYAREKSQLLSTNEGSSLFLTFLKDISVLGDSLHVLAEVCKCERDSDWTAAWNTESLGMGSTAFPMSSIVLSRIGNGLQMLGQIARISSTSNFFLMKPAHQQMLSDLQRSLWRVYMEICFKWINLGYLIPSDDPAGEFAIHCLLSNIKKGEDHRATDNGGEDFMSAGFAVHALASEGASQRSDNPLLSLPHFLRGRQCQLAIRTGKMLNLIRLTSLEVYRCCTSKHLPVILLQSYGTQAANAKELKEQYLAILHKQRTLLESYFEGVQTLREQNLSDAVEIRQLQLQQRRQQLADSQEAAQQRHQMERQRKSLVWKDLMEQKAEFDLRKRSTSSSQAAREGLSPQKKQQEAEDAEMLALARQMLVDKYGALIDEADAKLRISQWRRKRLVSLAVSQERLLKLLRAEAEHWEAERSQGPAALSTNISVEGRRADASTLRLSEGSGETKASRTGNESNPIRTTVRIVHRADNSTSDPASERDTPSVRVSQPPGGQMSLPGQREQKAVKVAQPPGGWTSEESSSHTGRSQAAHRATVKVSQPPGGTTGISAETADASDRRSVRVSQPPGGWTEMQSGPDEDLYTSSVRTSQPPGGHSTISLSSSDGPKVQQFASANSTAPASEVAAIEPDQDKEAVSLADSFDKLDLETLASYADEQKLGDSEEFLVEDSVSAGLEEVSTPPGCLQLPESNDQEIGMVANEISSCPVENAFTESSSVSESRPASGRATQRGGSGENASVKVSQPPGGWSTMGRESDTPQAPSEKVLSANNTVAMSSVKAAQPAGVESSVQDGSMSDTRSVKVSQPPGGHSTVFDSSLEPNRPSVRVSQPPGGHAVNSDDKTSFASVRIMQPPGGWSDLSQSYVESSSEGGQPFTSVKVSQPPGGWTAADEDDSLSDLASLSSINKNLAHVKVSQPPGGWTELNVFKEESVSSQGIMTTFEERNSGGRLGADSLSETKKSSDTESIKSRSSKAPYSGIRLLKQPGGGSDRMKKLLEGGNYVPENVKMLPKRRNEPTAIDKLRPNSAIDVTLLRREARKFLQDRLLEPDNGTPDFPWLSSSSQASQDIPKVFAPQIVEEDLSNDSRLGNTVTDLEAELGDLIAQRSQLVDFATLNMFIVELECVQHFKALCRFMLAEAGNTIDIWCRLFLRGFEADCKVDWGLENNLTFAFKDAITASGLEDYRFHELFSYSVMSASMRHAQSSPTYEAILHEAVACLTPQYRIDWPLGIVIPRECLHLYAMVHKELLTQKLVLILMNELVIESKKHLRVLDKHWRWIASYRHELHYLIKNIHTHATLAVVQHEKAHFADALSKASDIYELREVHLAFITRVHQRCFLSHASREIHEGLVAIQRKAMALVGLLREPMARGIPVPEAIVAQLIKQRESLRVIFRGLFQHLKEEMDRAPQEDIWNFQALLSQLNFNNYYGTSSNG